MAEHDSRAVASGGLLCSCRKAVGEFCPDVAVAGGDDDSLSIELTDEMKQFLVRSKRRRIERQEQRRAADAERARRECRQALAVLALVYSLNDACRYARAGEEV